MPLPHRYASLSDLADQRLADAHQEVTPIDIQAVVNTLPMTVAYETADDDRLAFWRKDADGQWCWVVNSGRFSDAVKRWLAAYGVAAFLNGSFDAIVPTKGWQNDAALKNDVLAQFADLLLVPRFALKILVVDRNIVSFERMTGYFHVSERVLHRRLLRDGWIAH